MSIVDNWQVPTLQAKPRTRSRGVLTPVQAGYITVDGTCTSGTVNTAYGASAHTGERQTTWDSVTPDFFARSARGEIISNPFRTVKESYTAQGDFFQVKYVTPSCTSPVKYATVDFYGPQAYWRLKDDGEMVQVVNKLVAESDIAEAMKVAGTQAWNKSNHHDADVLIDVVEFGQTLRMLRDPLQTTSTFLRKILQRQRRGAKGLNVSEALAYAESQWLQYRYGIRPLVSTVNGVVKALSRSFARKRHTYRGSYRLKSVSTETGILTAGTVCPFAYSFSYSDEVLVRAGVLLEDEVTFVQDLGIDASGMLALPWETIPLSHVWDWFMNVGSFLGSIAPFLTQTPLSSWTTVKQSKSSVFLVTGVATPIPSSIEVIRAPSEIRTAIVEETRRSPALIVPSLTWKPKPLVAISNDLRIVDSFALVHQLFNRAFRP